MGDDRAITRVEDGVVVIRASALGQCTRALWASLDDIPGAADPDWLIAAAQRGNRYEIAMNAWLKEQGYVIISSQDEVEFWVIPGKLKILGHTDGVVRKPKGKLDYMLEIKSMSPTVFSDWMTNGFKTKTGYAWQLSVYMAATGMPAHYVAVRAHEEANKMSQEAIYQHAFHSDTAIDYRTIKKAPFTEQEIKAKAMAVYKAYKTGEMPPCEDVFPCKWFFLHDEEEDPPDQLPITVAGAEYRDELVEEYMMLKRQAEAVKRRMGDTRLQLMAIGAFETPEYVITISERKGRLSLDKARLAADNPAIDLSKYESRGEPTQALTVKEK